MINCKIPECNFSCLDLIQHIIETHKITVTEYRHLYGDELIDESLKNKRIASRKEHYTITCEICKEKFPSKENLNSHLEKSKDLDHNHHRYNETNVDDWIECKICHLRKLTLKKHILEHNFSVQSYEIQHGAVHSKNYATQLEKNKIEKRNNFNFECLACPLKFTTQESLQNHIERSNDTKHSHLIYNETNMNDWVECNIDGFRRSDLRKHLKLVHNLNTEQYDGEVFSKNYKENQLKNFQTAGSNAPRKEKEKNFVCTICGEMFSTELQLKYHIEKTREKEHSKLIYNELNKSDWVECVICGLRRKKLSNHIELDHEDIITLEDYELKYETLSENYLKQLHISANSKHESERFLGENNPYHGHMHTLEEREQTSCTLKENNSQQLVHFNVGRKDSEETGLKKSLSRMGEKNHRYGKPAASGASQGISGYRKDIDLDVDSTLEANYVRYLMYNNIEFKYEYKGWEVELENEKATCWIDFYLPGTDEWIELKNYVGRDLTKINLVKEKYPELKIKVIYQDSEEWKKIENEYKDKIALWEIDGRNLRTYAFLYTDKERQEEKFLNKIEKEDYVRCMICQWPEKHLKFHIMNDHNSSINEYKQQFPNAKIMSEKLAEKDRIKKEIKKGEEKKDITNVLNEIQLPISGKTIMLMDEAKRAELSTKIFNFLRNKKFPSLSYSNKELLDDFLCIKKATVTIEDKSIHCFNSAGYKLKNHFLKQQYSKIEELFNNDEILTKVIRNRCGLDRITPEFFNIDERMILKGFEILYPGSRYSTYSCILAKWIIDTFCEGDTVYDYSAGWGARMIGTIASDKNYIGVDTNTKLVSELNDLSKWLTTYMHKNIQIENQDASKFKPNIQVDLAYSCPPYGIKENYNNMTFSNDNEWFEKYMQPVIKNCYEILKPTKKFVCHISSKLSEIIKLEAGRYFTLIDEYFVINKHSPFAKKERKRINEVILVFQKTN